MSQQDDDRPWTPQQQRQMIACRDHLAKTLEQEAKQRADRGDGWLTAELEAVTDAANAWASRHGHLGVTLAEVQRIDAISTGCDWGDKVALRVAFLVADR